MNLPSPHFLNRLPANKTGMLRQLAKSNAWLENMVETISPRALDTNMPDALAGRAIRFGLWAIVIVFGGFGLWAVTAPIDSAAVASGTVVVDSARKTVQHLEGGIIEKILVKEGTIVKKGQPLIRLNETAARARFDLVNAQLVTMQVSEARLIAERDNKEEITMPKSVLAHRKDPKVAEVIDTQTRLFNSRRDALNGQINILNQKIQQSKEEIAGLTSQEKSTRDQIGLINEEVSTVRFLLKKGNAVKPRLLALERAAADLEGQQGQYKAMISRAKQVIAESDLAIINQKNDYLNKTVQELRDTQLQLSDLRERSKSSEDIYNRINITAPIDGIVTGMQVHTVGGVIGPGEKIMDIVPTNDKLIIEAMVMPQDIDVVHVGQTARIRLTAFKSRITPQVDGNVINVSADRFMDQRTGHGYYTARVEVSKEEMDALKKEKHIELYPGMPADVMIVVGERTFFNYVMSPIRDSFAHAFREQ